MADVICLSETENTVKKSGSTPGPSQMKSSSKRLKQARLPFAVINQKITRQPTVTELFAPKKRKLSGEIDSLATPKLAKYGNDKGDQNAKTKQLTQDTSEEEVSSSTTDLDKNKIPDVVPPSEKSKDFLKRFLNRKTQQNDVSTSVVDSTLDPTKEVAILTDKVDTKSAAVEVNDPNLCSASSLTPVKVCDHELESIETGTPKPTPLANSAQDCLNADVEIIEVSDNQTEDSSEPESDNQGEDKNTATSELSSDKCGKAEKHSDKAASKSDHSQTENVSPFATAANDSLSTLTSPEPTKHPVGLKPTPTSSKKRKLGKETEQEKVQRREERKRKRLEREQQLEEQRRLKKEAKEQKEREKSEAVARKKEEQEKKAREKQERLQQKEEEKKKKQEEKEKKRQEENDAKLEEKRKKELDKSLREEEKTRVNEKSKAAFVSFFVKKDGTQTQLEPTQCTGQFKPFEIKDNMRMAPLVRVDLTEDNLLHLDEHLDKQEQDLLYLQEIKKKARLPGKWGRTWPPDDSCEVVEVSFEGDVVPAEKPKMPRAKLLKFHENVRPPYWGTWQKSSAVVTARKPFGHDKLFDYEVDSDDEWEEEEPGESLSGTEDEKESEDEYEVDNEFFVPHGYLSDEENKDEDEECTPPDMQKAKLKMKELEFEEEMKKKTQQIKPKVLGCIWMGDTKPGIDELIKVLEPFKAVLLQSTPIFTSTSEAKTELNETPPRTPGTGKTPVSGRGPGKRPVPEEAMPDLIKLLHGNKNNRFLLAREFIQFWNPRVELQVAESREEMGSELPTPPQTKLAGTVSKRQLGKTIQEIAVYQKCPQPGVMRGKCWCVHNDVLAKYGLSDLSFPNTWKYVGEQSSNTSILFSSPVSLPPVVNTPSVSDLLNNPISYNKALTSSAKKPLNLTDAKIPGMLISSPSPKKIPSPSLVSIPGFAGGVSPIVKSESSKEDVVVGDNAQEARADKMTASSSGPKRIKPLKIGPSIAKFFRSSSPSVAAGNVIAKSCTKNDSSLSMKIEQKSSNSATDTSNVVPVIELD